MGDELLQNDSEGLSCLLDAVSDHIETHGLTDDTRKQLRSMLGFSDYKPHRGRGVEGNDMSGNGCQVNFHMMLMTIRTAHKNKVDELRQILSDTHWAHSYEQQGYMHSTRGQHIEMLGHQLNRLSQMLYMLQGMNGNERRLRNFHWVFDEQGDLL